MISKNTIVEIKHQIDQLQEYIDTEICKKCEEMRAKLIGLKSIVDQFDNETNTKNNS